MASLRFSILGETHEDGSEVEYRVLDYRTKEPIASGVAAIEHSVSVPIPEGVDAVVVESLSPVYLLAPSPVFWDPSGQELNVGLRRSGSVVVRIDAGMSSRWKGRVYLVAMDSGSLFDAEDAGLVKAVSVGEEVLFAAVPPGRYLAQLKSDFDGKGVQGRAVVVIPGQESTVLFSDGDEEPVFLTGQVEFGGGSLIGAKLSLSSTRWESKPGYLVVRLDDDGRFEGRLPYPGTYSARIDSSFGRLHKATISLDSGVQELSIQIPSVNICGNVKTAEGRPVLGAEVHARSVSRTVETMWTDRFMSAETDREGHFCLAVPLGGEYRLSTGGANEFRQGPSWNRYAEASLIVSAAADAEVELVLEEPATASGRVLDLDGSPARASIYAKRRDMPGAKWAQAGYSGEDGQYEARFLGRGPLYLVARVERNGLQPRSSQIVAVDLSRDGPGARIDFQLHPAAYVIVEALGAGQDLQAVRAEARSRCEFGEIDLPISSGNNHRLQYEQKLGPLPGGDYVIVAEDVEGKQYSWTGEVSGGRSVQRETLEAR